MTFELGTDLNMAQVLVQNRVARRRPLLPDVVKAIGVTDQEAVAQTSCWWSTCTPTTTRRPASRTYDQLYLSNYATIQLKDAAGPR